MEISASTEVTIQITLKGEELDRLVLLINAGIYYKEDIIKDLTNKPTSSKVEENFNDNVVKGHRADIDFGQEFIRKLRLKR